MISHTEVSLHQVAVHYIGNQQEGEDIIYTGDLLDISDAHLHQVLTKYFISPFQEPEYFQFSFPTGELELNPVYNFVSNIFDDPSCLHEQSVKIARHLYEKSKHPNIKAGELYIAYLDRVIIDDQVTEAIAIFKSENKNQFLQLTKEGALFALHADDGTNISQVDKACLIFNLNSDHGFKIVNIDHSNRYRDAQYWREEFLMITHFKDDYHNTKNYIQATKSFIKDRMSKEFDTDKSDEASIMHRSQEYFKHTEKFDAVEYEERVFKDGKVIESFQDFKSEYENTRATTLDDQFDISDYAVKKQSRVFKSVIKLDKNFHIYVHGDKNKIMKGQDDEGRKYYILYYEDEN
ncbi:MAG: nucleoid-associated protein [Saprospiraceae bacterium]